MNIDNFLLLDGFELVEGSEPIRARGRTRVPEAHSLFDGHFPGFPVLPGVLHVEIMAQTCGHLAISQEPTKLPFLLKIRNATFKSKVTPGQELVAEVELIARGDLYAEFNAKLSDSQAVVSKAVLYFSLLRLENPVLQNELLAGHRRLLRAHA